MKLIVGLGNPGKKYENNRHNVGFMVVDRIVREVMVSPHIERKLESTVFYHHASGTVFAKPQTFMNDSGKAVAKLVNWYKINPNDIYVIHDDLDISLGAYKIQYGRGPRLHYGVQSIEKALGTEDFWRVRIGVDNRKVPEVSKVPKVSKAWRTPGEQYVLQDFTEEEQEIVDEVINKFVEELKPIIQ